MTERVIPKGTERCVRRATANLWGAPADIETPLDIPRFRRSIGYGPREIFEDEPVPGHNTYEIGCAVTGCECMVRLIRAEGATMPTSLISNNMETCKRI